MRFISLFTVLCILLLVFCASCNSQEKLDKEAEAVKAAHEWLVNVDNGLYEESWDSAAAYFKNALTREDWAQMLNNVRKPLGGIVSRKLSKKKYTQSLPGAPDGDYVVIQFKTKFENKASSVETVTPMMEKDGTWRVAGYFIK